MRRGSFTRAKQATRNFVRCFGVNIGLTHLRERSVIAPAFVLNDGLTFLTEKSHVFHTRKTTSRIITAFLLKMRLGLKDRGG